MTELLLDMDTFALGNLMPMMSSPSIRNDILPEQWEDVNCDPIPPNARRVRDSASLQAEFIEPPHETLWPDAGWRLQPSPRSLLDDSIEVLEQCLQTHCRFTSIYRSSKSPYEDLLCPHAESSAAVRNSIISIAVLYNQDLAVKPNLTVANSRFRAVADLAKAMSSMSKISAKTDVSRKRRGELEHALLAIILIGSSSVNSTLL